jgi:uncharacterized membrane protein YgcG
MKKLLSLMLVLIVALSLAASVSAAEFPYVYDEAQVLTAGEETALAERLEKLGSTCGHRIVAVTVDDVPGGDRDAVTEYACGIAFQTAAADVDGMMLLLSEGTQEAWVHVGGACGSIINEKVQKRIVGAGEDALEQRDYYRALRNYANKTEDFLSGKAYRFPFLWAAAAALAAAFLTAKLVGKKLKGQLKNVYGSFYPENSKLELTTRTDELLCQKLEKTAKPKEEKGQTSGSKK